MAKREAFPSEKLDQYMLRFPDGLRERLKDEAAKNKRSLNAEIIDRLETSFVMDETLTIQESELAEIKKSVNELKVAFALMRSEKKASP